MIAGALGLYYLRTSQSEFARSFRAVVKNYLRMNSLQKRPDLAEGLTIEKETVYVDGAIGSMPDKLDGHDVKVLYETPDGHKFCDYANGLSVMLPSDMVPDFSTSPSTYPSKAETRKSSLAGNGPMTPTSPGTCGTTSSGSC
jgi:hypothetical protein